MPYLGHRSRPYPGALPPLEPISERLRDGFRADGLEPFPLPLAIDFEKCLRCPSCPGYLCPTGARASSWRNTLEPALRTGRLDVWERCEAEALESQGGRVRSLRVRHRDGGRVERVTAEAFLVAAGAVGTPALLLRSGLEGRSGQVGRNHMCHLGAVPVAVFPRPIGTADRFSKQLGLTDLYLGTDEFPHKLGYAQSIPVPGPLTLRKHAGIPLPLSLARALHARSLLFTGSIEDLPQTENRVTLAADGTPRLRRRFHPYDLLRARWMTQRLTRPLRRSGAWVTMGRVAVDEHGHAGHQVGTCRAGRDPDHAVVDSQCRLYGHDNVYLIDGSVLPTSLGVGPALTIVANALRIAAHVAKEHA